MPQTKKQSNNNNLDFALAASVLLALFYFYGVLILLQDVRVSDILGSPNSLVALPSLILAVFVFVKSNASSRKYIAIAVITLLLSAFLAWLLGATSAGSYLAVLV